MTIVYEDLPVSGTIHWNGTCWVIWLSTRDSVARQRFTALHEWKHILDHGTTERLYTGDRRRSRAEQAESVADYFAGCALVPKRHLKRMWGSGLQRIGALANHFGVSAQAIRVRLAQTGLNVIADHLPAARCARPVSTARLQPQRFRIARPAYARRRLAG